MTSISHDAVGLLGEGVRQKEASPWPWLHLSNPGFTAAQPRSDRCQIKGEVLAMARPIHPQITSKARHYAMHPSATR